MGSFCNLRFRGQRLGSPHELGGKGEGERSVCLQGLELTEGAMEAVFDTGVVASETVELLGQLGVIEGVGSDAAEAFSSASMRRMRRRFQADATSSSNRVC